MSFKSLFLLRCNLLAILVSKPLKWSRSILRLLILVFVLLPYICCCQWCAYWFLFCCQLYWYCQCSDCWYWFLFCCPTGDHDHIRDSAVASSPPKFSVNQQRFTFCKYCWNCNLCQFCGYCKFCKYFYTQQYHFAKTDLDLHKSTNKCKEWSDLSLMKNCLNLTNLKQFSAVWNGCLGNDKCGFVRARILRRFSNLVSNCGFPHHRFQLCDICGLKCDPLDMWHPLWSWKI